VDVDGSCTTREIAATDATVASTGQRTAAAMAE
jgi:hypothetical protein